MKKITFITLLILTIDQIVKSYIKTHFKIGDNFPLIWIFEIFFVENPGMAFGIYIGNGYLYKIILTIIRFIICTLFIIWIYKNTKIYKSNYFTISISLILAGAIGNIVDSMFYGILFDKGLYYSNINNKWINYSGISKFSYDGYSFFMGGCVVDMISISLKDIIIPKYIPLIGGQNFYIFKPIFNIADICITLGVLIIIFLHKKVFKKNYTL